MNSSWILPSNITSDGIYEENLEESWHEPYMPDLFVDAGSQLQDVVDRKNTLHCEMLQHDTLDRRGRFRSAQGVVAKAVRRTKEE